MHDDELWQAYEDNGSPIKGTGYSESEFKKDASLIMGNSHVWFWRKKQDKVDILLQQRSLTCATKPGWLHISAGGHVNIGESPTEAAAREAREEMGVEVNVSKLHFSFSTRIIGRAPNDIVHVYLYPLIGDEEFTYNDGEVQSCRWLPLDDFIQITQDAERNKLINQGSLYFSSLINSLEYVALGSNSLL